MAKPVEGTLLRIDAASGEVIGRLSHVAFIKPARDGVDERVIALSPESREVAGFDEEAKLLAMEIAEMHLKMVLVTLEQVGKEDWYIGKSDVPPQPFTHEFEAKDVAEKINRVAAALRRLKK